MIEADRTDLLPSEAARFDEVCRLGHDQLEPIATTVAAAFAEDPIWRWLFSGNQQPMTNEQMMAFARFLVRGIVAPKEIHGFRHHRAVALWHAPIDALVEPAPDDEPSASEIEFRHQVAPLMADVRVIADLSSALKSHRPDEPHWYLGIIGTHPDHQGQGMAGRLLQTMHERCDRLHLPTYLESSNPANNAFYRHQGYTETVEFAAAGSPSLTGFWRSPQ